MLKLKKMPYMPLYCGDWLSSRSVNALPLASQGLFLRCLILQWDTGPLPTDPAEIALLVGNPPGFTEAWEPLAKLFHAVSNGIANRRSAEIREEWDALRTARADAGRRGNDTRHGPAKSSQNSSKGIAKTSPSDPLPSHSASDPIPSSPLKASASPPARKRAPFISPVARFVLDHLQKLRGSARAYTDAGQIPGALSRGATGPDCVLVLDWIFARGQGDEFWLPYLDQVTPFRAANFAKYLVEAADWDAAGRPPIIPAGNRGGKSRPRENLGAPVAYSPDQQTALDAKTAREEAKSRRWYVMVETVMREQPNLPADQMREVVRARLSAPLPQIKAVRE